MKKQQWLIKDLIDLEYFLHNDEDRNGESAHLRDREICLNQISFKLTQSCLEKLRKKNFPNDLATKLEVLKDQNYAGEKEFTDALDQTLGDEAESHKSLILNHARPKRPAMIRQWLDKRRQAENEKDVPDMEKILPGDVFAGVHNLMLYFLVITGAVFGSGLAFSLLMYKGAEPVNISGYVGVLVLIQMLLILILIMTLGLRGMNVSVVQPVHLLFSSILGKLLVVMKARLPAAHGNTLELVIGLIKGKSKIYGSLFYWPIFIMAQVFGIGFNLGVLSATVIRVLGTDLAFGWESTIQWGSQAVYNIVRFIAIPWSWFVPSGVAHPTPEQIQGSRIILKDGIYGLATPDLVSWWPFLCLAVLFYGFLPRVILFAAGLMVQNKALDRLSFRHVPYDKLIRRMTTPSVITQGEEKPSKSAEPAAEVSEPADRSEVTRTTGNGLIVLVPEDIFDNCSDEALRTVVLRTFGSAIQEKMEIVGELEEDKDRLEAAARATDKDHPATILLLQEAWQPPIKESLSFIQALRQIFGPESNVFVCLIGKPGPNTIFTKPLDQNWQIWETEIRKSGDPHIGIERLEADHGAS